MTAQDHNKTLVILHAAIGAFFTFRVGRFAVDHRAELQAPGQDTDCSHRFRDRTAGGDTFLDNCDCHVSPEAYG
jgi:hypothetical protein